jgi:hypothetical protein
VVEFTFLADFDLLRDTRQDIRTRPWATPAARLAMDSYFKVLRAAEEVERLNVEIPRLTTFMRDEEAYLLAKETELSSTDPVLAHQVQIYRKQRGRFIGHHTAILNQLAALPGFTGGSFFGVRATDQTLPGPVELPPMTPDPGPMQVSDNTEVENEMIDEEDDLTAEQAGEDQDEHLVGAFYTVLKMSDDGGTLISL